MATFLAIKQRVLRHFNQQDEALAMLPVPMASTSTTSSGNLTIVDTKLSRSSTSDGNRFDKRFVEVVETVSSSPTIGTVAVIGDAGYNSSTIITVAPDMGAVMQGGTDYLLYALGLSPTSVAQYINDTLRLTHGPHLWFPSLVPDAEFEAATAWADITSSLGTGPEFLTTGGGAFLAADMLFGERYLNAISDGAGEGMHSATFRVHENMTLLVSIMARVVAGDSWDVELYDETGSAIVTPAVTISDELITEVRMQRQVLTDSETMRIRFTANGTSDEINVSPPIIVQPQGWHAYPAPSWLTAPKAQLVQAREMPTGAGGTENDVYLALTRPPIAGAIAPGYRSDNWVTPNFINVETRSRPTYFTVKRAYDELTSLTSTTNCDEDYVTYKAISRVYADRGEEGNERKWGLRAAEIARTMGYGTGGAKIVENPLVSV